MQYYNSGNQPWMDLSDELKLRFADAQKQGLLEMLDDFGQWDTVTIIHIPKPGRTYRCPMQPKVVEVALEAFDIKPGDVISHPSYDAGVWVYVEPKADWVSLRVSDIMISYKDLMQKGYLIKSLGETEYRKCSKYIELDK
jgi:hypothetical protein